MRIIDLTKILRGYERKWVAIASDYKKVVGSGVSLKVARAQALKRGFKQPILTKILPFRQGYIPSF